MISHFRHKESNQSKILSEVLSKPEDNDKPEIFIKGKKKRSYLVKK